jgi:hypothetical protein
VSSWAWWWPLASSRAWNFTSSPPCISTSCTLTILPLLSFLFYSSLVPSGCLSSKQQVFLNTPTYATCHPLAAYCRVHIMKILTVSLSSSCLLLVNNLLSTLLRHAHHNYQLILKPFNLLRVTKTYRYSQLLLTLFTEISRAFFLPIPPPPPHLLQIHQTTAVEEPFLPLNPVNSKQNNGYVKRHQIVKLLHTTCWTVFAEEVMTWAGKSAMQTLKNIRQESWKAQRYKFQSW